MRLIHKDFKDKQMITKEFTVTAKQYTKLIKKFPKTFYVYAYLLNGDFHFQVNLIEKGFLSKVSEDDLYLFMHVLVNTYSDTFDSEDEQKNIGYIYECQNTGKYFDFNFFKDDMKNGENKERWIKLKENQIYSIKNIEFLGKFNSKDEVDTVLISK